jgi:hypothetical protein
MKNLLIIISLLISWSAVAEEKIWYCNPEAAAGLKFNNGAYEPTSFNVDRATIKQVGNNFTFPDNPALHPNTVECSTSKSMAICDTGVGISFYLNYKDGHAQSSVSSIGWLYSSEGIPEANMFVVAWKCETF